LRAGPAKAVGNDTKAGLTIQPGKGAKRPLLSIPLQKFRRLTVKNFPPTVFTTLDSMIAMLNTTSFVNNSSAPMMVTSRARMLHAKYFLFVFLVARLYENKSENYGLKRILCWTSHEKFTISR
jgi:hypothetical protein